MPRPLRIHFANAWYHVMNRGADRKPIFKNRAHRIMFLNILSECCKMFNIKIHAYCLMENHYHLLLSTPDANLSRAMRHINGVYTQRYNRSQKKDGPLFRGRYKSKLVDDDCYSLMVSRYIHLNPLVAKLVDNAADYEWSSYQAYLGLAAKPAWLTVDIILEKVSKTKLLQHIDSYRNYVEKVEIKEINIFHGEKYTSPIVGSEVFKNKILSNIDALTKEACAPDIRRARTIPSIELIIKEVCHFYNIYRDLIVLFKRGYFNLPKLVCIYICRKHFGYTLREISKPFAPLSRGSVSTAIAKCNKLLAVRSDVSDDIDSICKVLSEVILQGDT